MGLTLPEDYCFLCHEDIADERPSHQGMGFDTCASAGCHNYHDNKALYEAFLVKNADQPALQAIARIARRSPASLKHGDQFTGPALDAAQADGPAAHPASAILTDWLGTAHAEAGINCSGCHQAATGPAQTGTTDWNDKPGIAVCQSCHASEAAGFFQGKHGMRLAPDLPISLPPMTPAQGRLAFNDDAAHRQLTCNSCHAPHRFDVREAAVESCLGCHADDHSRAYKTSPHFQLWQAETAGQADAGSGVSCATCHLPRELLQVAGHERVVVNHNQNANLRPNEKMIRSVCQSCHGLAFSIDALADPQLIRSNFTGQPARHIESVDMALKREQDQAAQ
jgi:predicted CXXCH cytochrome family protein